MDISGDSELVFNAPVVDSADPYGFDALADPKAVYDRASWSQQSTDFTCAVVSQQMVLRQFGIELSEAQLVYEATSNGLLTDSGTSPEDLGQLLEMHGVPVHEGYGADALIDDLARGHKVIVALDSGETWGTDWPLEDFWKPQGADHAVVVTGLDLSDAANPLVVVNDPGDPEGAGRALPLGNFLDAWRDSGEYFVATDEAPPDLADHPVLGHGFNAGSGQYMDPAFWENLRTRFGHNLVANIEHVAQRHMDEGTFADSLAGAVLKSITDTIEDLNDAERNELFRQI